MKNILLPWDSYNHGFIVTLNSIYLLFEDKKIKIDEVYYLIDKNLQKGTISEIKIFENKSKLKDEILNYSETDRLQKSFIEHIKETQSICNKLNFRPKLITKNINITSVVDYQSIYDALRNFLKTEIFILNDLNLHINCSPGTPQMHVVWLMLNSSGYLHQNTTLWSSQYNQDTKKTFIEKINFKPQTYLHEVFASAFQRKFDIEINPNDTKSVKRKEAEEKIQLYANIPDIPILILGERGTGKSTIVRNLIALQKNKAYREIACGIFSEELMRSELFGHSKGAFTGAIKDKKGILEEIDNGILFLDEIHDLTKPLQRQLIQVLQTGEYYAVGSEKSKKSNFRLICASNLSIEILRTKLDYDFFDRIAYFIVELPAIRDCKEDFEMFWKKSWTKIANLSIVSECVWNEKIKTYLEKSNLAGNFRDIEKLIALIIANLVKFKSKDVDNAIKLAIEEFEKWNIFSIKNNTSFFQKDKTYKEIISNFNKDLAIWAENEYGNIKNASQILERTEDMLRKDKQLYRLNKK